MTRYNGYSSGQCEIVEIPAETFYGKGYQDILTRKPSIEKAKRLLGWEPSVGLEEAMHLTLNSFLEENKQVSV